MSLSNELELVEATLVRVGAEGDELDVAFLTLRGGTCSNSDAVVVLAEDTQLFAAHPEMNCMTGVWRGEHDVRGLDLYTAFRCVVCK